MSRFIAIIAVVAVMFGMVITGGEPVHAFAPIIVDNEDIIGPLDGANRVEITNGWWTKDGTHLIPVRIPCAGDDYLEASTTDGVEDTVTWIPDLPVAGFYDVSVCWIEGENYWRTKKAEYEITYVNEQGGVDWATVVRNQFYSGLGGTYVSLGTFYFNAGTGGSVKITDDGADTQIIIADAVRFTLVDAASIPTDIIADTGEAELTGNWIERTRGWLWYTYYGYNYQQASTTDGTTDTAAWTPYLPVTGLYNIYGYWPDSVPWWRADTATYIITDIYPEISYTVDIQSQSETWVPIGSGTFREGQYGSVTITDADDDDSSGRSKDSVIVADAVKFELDCAVVVAPEKGYAPTVNIGTASTIDYTVDTPYTATLVGAGCAGQSPAWTWTASDNNTIATVDLSSGLVSGVSEGKAQITAMATVNGNQIAGAHEVVVTSRLVDKAWIDQHPDAKVIVAISGTAVDTTKIIPGALLFKDFPTKLTLGKNPTAPTNGECHATSNSIVRWTLKDVRLIKNKLAAIGISENDNLVVYDYSTNIFGRGDLATYVLWVLEMVGHDTTKLHLLNGQWKQWVKDGGTFGTKGAAPTVTYDPNNEQLVNDSIYGTGCFIYEHLAGGAQATPAYAWVATIGDYGTWGATSPLGEFTDHHLPCAKQIDFEENFISSNTYGGTNDWRFKSPSVLEDLYITQNGVTRDKYISVY